jgi:hypothetical protein
MIELPVVDDKGNAFFIQIDNDEAALVTTEERVSFVHTQSGTYRYITAPYDLARALASKQESGYRKITVSSIINLNAVTVEEEGEEMWLHFPPVGKRKFKIHEVTRRNKKEVISYLKDKGKI